MKEPEPEAAAGLRRAILREEVVYTAAEVAEAAGITLAQARRLWRALGFPEYGNERAFTPADLDALKTLVSMVDGELIDFDVAVTLTRALGQTMARLSDWEVSALVQRLERVVAKNDVEGEGPTSRLSLAMELVDDLTHPFEDLLLYGWRRHLAAAAVRMEGIGAHTDEATSTEVTVGFADIVAFTALSNSISRDRIGDLVEVFESRCADVIATQRGRVIKSLGDAVLFVNDDPIRAYDTAEGIINVVGRDPRMPDVRVGLASGGVVMRLGDVFGPPVNLASRLTSVARRNRIIVDNTTAELLPDDQFESRRLPARPVRGFGLLEPVAVRRH